MNFSQDRDLLALEPAVFHDLPLLGQQPMEVSDASLSGTSLSTASADLASLEIQAGHVVLIAEVSCEVVARVDAGTLTVSLPRSDREGALLPPGPAHGPVKSDSELVVKWRTFAPQASLVHDDLLRLLGMDPDEADPAIGEEALQSPKLLARLEALGTLHRLYQAGAAVAGGQQGLIDKADRHGRAYQELLRQACVRLDANADGVAESSRTLGSTALRRV